jgi:hypothetical protein
MKISRHRGAVWVLAAIIFLNVAVIHLLLEWSRFPWLTPRRALLLSATPRCSDPAC